MVHMLGGKIEGGTSREFGRAFIEKVSDDPLFESMFANGDKEEVWMSHGDHVSKIAPGFEVYGTSPNAPFAITGDVSRNFYAVQFHPEVHHTPVLYTHLTLPTSDQV